MAIRSRFSLAAAALLVLALAACSDDDNPTGGGTPDTTPPTVSSVTPVDAFHIDVTFNEEVSKSSAENDANYSITEAATPLPVPPRASAAAPGDPMPIAGVTLKNDHKSVTITTGSSMAGLNYDLTVDNVSDTHGNGIDDPIGNTFTGSNTADTTPPQITGRSPAAGAMNVPIGTTVTVQFSEAVTFSSFSAGTSWTSQQGPVPFSVQQDGTTFTLSSIAPLEHNSLQTITLQGIQDPAGNTMTDTEWSFTTTNVSDNTPPTLVSTTPANNATNVDVNANLSLTFSEAVNQVEYLVMLVPDPGDGVPTWSNGGKTLTFDPFDPLIDNTQYTLTIYPGGVLDLSGNGIVGLHTVVFTTGAALEAGSIAGTITGDTGSQAADPTGATVIAALGSVFDGGGDFGIAGSTTVAGNNTYTLSHLPDAVYYPLAVFDTNDDGTFDPGYGDAIGAYGVEDFLDTTPDSVTISGGTHATGINFALFDPSAILGTVTYSGINAEGSWNIYVGLFDTTGFSPTAEPVAGTQAYWPELLEWGFNTFDNSFPDDQYYVGAYLDVNDNGTYDPASDPAGMYGGFNSPTAINVVNGADFSGIVIPMADPVPGMTGSAVTWPAAKHSARFQRLRDVVRQAEIKK